LALFAPAAESPRNSKKIKEGEALSERGNPAQEALEGEETVSPRLVRKKKSRSRRKRNAG